MSDIQPPFAVYGRPAGAKSAERVSPWFDAPQFCEHWIRLCRESDPELAGTLTVMVRRVSDERTKTGKVKSWVEPYVGQTE